MHRLSRFAESYPEIQGYISVDVETAGPHPAGYALLSIGACSLFPPRRTFYIELKPDRPGYTAEAMAIHNLSLEALAESGRPPEEAMRAFGDWIFAQFPGLRPVFVGFNAAFDWMFINDYFHRYLGSNPFGHSAIDIKSYAMGRMNIPWSQTSLAQMELKGAENRPLTHNALQDAIDQAQIFTELLFWQD